MSRKMSIRALNVVTMHRFSPGSITNGNQRISNVGINSYRSDSALKVGNKQSMNRPSILLRASSLLAANARKSSINHRQTLNRISNLKNQKQQSVVSGRDSTFDANLSVEEEDSIPGIVGMSVHRCSMIKKYNIETFFSPAK